MGTKKTAGDKPAAAFSNRKLLLPELVLQTANGVLDLAGGLVGLAFGLQLGVAGDFARGFLDAALGLLRGPFNTIFIHVDDSPLILALIIVPVGTKQFIYGPADFNRIKIRKQLGSRNIETTSAGFNRNFRHYSFDRICLFFREIGGADEQS
jgi:hypothetical protein